MSNNEDTPFQCDECDRSFKTANALLTHKRYHKARANFDEAMVAPEPQPTPRFDTIPEIDDTPVVGTPLLISRDELIKAFRDPGTVYIRKLSNYGSLPDITRATEGSAGYDLYAAIDHPRCIGVGDREPITTGLSIELPRNLVGKVVPRSGLALRNGISLLNTPGIIDSDYRGEIIAIMVNHSTRKFWVEPGMRIAQILFEQVTNPDIVYVDNLTDTNRGSGGFGSTGA